MIITGTASPDSVIVITLDPSNYQSQATANADGNWMIKINTALQSFEPGKYKISIYSILGSQKSKQSDFSLTLYNDDNGQLQAKIDSLENENTKLKYYLIGISGILIISLISAFYIRKMLRLSSPSLPPPATQKRP